mmetsp:Transcript_17362/g.22536  ORF Transcript_17362/g.22536 Transcript_17362/m.22536 type:complete len:443 (+) Transcript_17362:114-1442(+)
MGTTSSSEQNESQTVEAPTPPLSEEDDGEKKMSYWEQANEGYRQLVDAIVRPPRAEYEERHLGPREFKFGNKSFRRRDFILRNSRGMKIVVSHWEPFDRDRQSNELPCVIYMHGNSSARVEALPQLSLVLGLGATMLSFDFTGSGQSDGDYVSLGYFEREDLKVVVDHLRATGRTSTVALWGRSMGAATSLMHGDRDPSIAAMILDSPFSDLTVLAEEMVDKGREQGLMVPGFVVSIAMSFIRSSVRKKAGFSIKDISPIKRVDQCFIPALFVAGAEDDFIHPRHSSQIHAKYAGDKNLVLVEGDHNSPRPQFMFDSVAIFLQSYLQIDPSWALDSVQPYNNGNPPWVASVSRPLRQFDDDLEALMALDMNDGHHLGMTTERQRQTEQALFSMLGGGAQRNLTNPQNDRNMSNSVVAEPQNLTPWTCQVVIYTSLLSTVRYQ